MNIIKKGFTLIELLIVIVIIGILAAAVITAINPVEQIKKANDSGKMSTANELVNAINIYYTTTLTYPWTTGVPNPGDTAVLVSSDPDGMLTTLTNTKDIKETLADRDFTGMQIWEVSTDGAPMVCFPPDSDAYLAKATYDALGRTGGTSYICAK